MDTHYIVLAQVAYAAYCAASNGKAFDGSPLKTWEELGEQIQGRWIASAKAVEAHTIAVQTGAAEAAGLADAGNAEASGNTDAAVAVPTSTPDTTASVENTADTASEPTETVTVAETTTLETADGNVTLNAGDQVEVPVEEAKDQQAA